MCVSVWSTTCAVCKMKRRLTNKNKNLSKRKLTLNCTFGYAAKDEPEAGAAVSSCVSLSPTVLVQKHHAHTSAPACSLLYRWAPPTQETVINYLVQTIHKDRNIQIQYVID